MMPCVKEVHRKNPQKTLDNCVIGFILSTLRVVLTLCRAQEYDPLLQYISIALVLERETDDAYLYSLPRHRPTTASAAAAFSVSEPWPPPSVAFRAQRWRWSAQRRNLNAPWIFIT